MHHSAATASAASCERPAALRMWCDNTHRASTGGGSTTCSGSARQKASSVLRASGSTRDDRVGRSSSWATA
eukprot:5261797-Lingulodinium_polyedra.AAC.1